MFGSHSVKSTLTMVASSVVLIKEDCLVNKIVQSEEDYVSKENCVSEDDCVSENGVVGKTV